MKLGKKLTHQTNQGERPLNASRGPKTVKILHVLGRMGAGGLENWLIQVLRHMDRKQMQIDLLVREAGLYDREAQALGANIFVVPYPSSPPVFAARFFRLLREHGPYQIIHSHLPLSGFILFLARWAGVPGRIFHCHIDETILKTKVNWRRRFSLALSRHLIRKYATHGLAVSRVAAVGIFGDNWQSDPRWRFFPCSIDLAPFTAPVDRQEVRRDLGIPAPAWVIGHVGRFFAQKNHAFLVEIAREVVNREPQAYFLLIGDGPLKPAIQEKVEQAGLTRNFIFTGVRRDVPRLMQGAMDAFLFPSFFEGMPLVMIEAQGAGLPCMVNEDIAEEAVVIPTLVQRLSLETSAAAWAGALLAIKDSPPTLSPREALAQIENTFFDIRTNVARLEALHRQLVTAVGA
ncbi:MAG: glycosyltransferase family 1 protein [Deltaproteobacteria bacterium]|nr:glycosyltransferase family 1 protein [Deltaproteobacteria bacterium]